MSFPRRVSAIAIATIVLFACRAGADEPTGFGEIKWGASRSAVETVCGSSKDDSLFREKSGFNDISCRPKAVTIGGSAFSPRLKLDPDDTLSAYDLNAYHRAYPEFRALLIDKFGPPLSTTTQQYRTGRGITVTGEEIRWQWDSGTTALLSEYCGQLTHSCVAVMTKPYREWLAEKLKQERERTKKSF
jgi:hypothetical protein